MATQNPDDTEADCVNSNWTVLDGPQRLATLESCLTSLPTKGDEWVTFG